MSRSFISEKCRRSDSRMSQTFSAVFSFTLGAWAQVYKEKPWKVFAVLLYGWYHHNLFVFLRLKRSTDGAKQFFINCVTKSSSSKHLFVSQPFEILSQIPDARKCLYIKPVDSLIGAPTETIARIIATFYIVGFRGWTWCVVNFRIWWSCIAKHQQNSGVWGSGGAW